MNKKVIEFYGNDYIKKKMIMLIKTIFYIDPISGTEWFS